jgi:hypothetical protein
MAVDKPVTAEKPVIESQEEDEFAEMRKSRRKWCIGGLVVGIISLAAVIFGIVW